MKLRYGFTKDGGFAVVDAISGHASYAYPTSSHCELAKYQPCFAATAMIRSALNSAIQSESLAAYDARIAAALDEMGEPDEVGLVGGFEHV